VACWRFMLDHYYHWYPPKEECVPEFVRDFRQGHQLLRVRPMLRDAPVLTGLWGGLRLRDPLVPITGHSIPEVKYGRWHMLDADARGCTARPTAGLPRWRNSPATPAAHRHQGEV